MSVHQSQLNDRHDTIAKQQGCPMYTYKITKAQKHKTQKHQKYTMPQVQNGKPTSIESEVQNRGHEYKITRTRRNALRGMDTLTKKNQNRTRKTQNKPRTPRNKSIYKHHSENSSNKPEQLSAQQQSSIQLQSWMNDAGRQECIVANLDWAAGHASDPSNYQRLYPIKIISIIQSNQIHDG